MPIDPILLQTVGDQLPTVHDVVVGPVRANYPWGSDLTGEAFAAAFAYVGKWVVGAWKSIERDRAVWSNDGPE